MIARLVTLLPHPDSPTRPSVSPVSTAKETPFTEPVPTVLLASCDFESAYTEAPG